MLLLASLAAKEPVVAEHDAALGAQAEAIARIVQQQFAGEIRRVMVAIVAAAACIGLVLGGAAGVLVDVHDAMLERSGVGRRGGPRWRLARALAITLALEAWFLQSKTAEENEHLVVLDLERALKNVHTEQEALNRHVGMAAMLENGATKAAAFAIFERVTEGVQSLGRGKWTSEVEWDKWNASVQLLVGDLCRAANDSFRRPAGASHDR